MPRRFLLIFLGAILLSLSLWLLLPKREAPRPLGKSAASAALPSGAGEKEIPLAPASVAGRGAARNVLAELRRTLQRPNARRNEAVLTFPSEEAYRNFLARARAAGLTVLGQIDALRTVRIRYDSL